jgi:hypothetical protein
MFGMLNLFLLVVALTGFKIVAFSTPTTFLRIFTNSQPSDPKKAVIFSSRFSLKKNSLKKNLIRVAIVVAVTHF